MAPLILRVLLAVVMFPHGAQKLLGWFGGYGLEDAMNFFTQTLHIPALLAFIAIVAEFLRTLALIAGVFTRVAAFGIGSVITVAALMGHLPNGFCMNWTGSQKREGVEYHSLMTTIAVAVVIQGGGKWALDSVISRKLAGNRSAESKAPFLGDVPAAC